MQSFLEILTCSLPLQVWSYIRREKLQNSRSAGRAVRCDKSLHRLFGVHVLHPTDLARRVEAILSQANPAVPLLPLELAAVGELDGSGTEPGSDFPVPFGHLRGRRRAESALATHSTADQSTIRRRQRAAPALADPLRRGGVGDSTQDSRCSITDGSLSAGRAVAAVPAGSWSSTSPHKSGPGGVGHLPRQLLKTFTYEPAMARDDVYVDQGRRDRAWANDLGNHPTHGDKGATNAGRRCPPSRRPPGR